MAERRPLLGEAISSPHNPIIDLPPNFVKLEMLPGGISSIIPKIGDETVENIIYVKHPSYFIAANAMTGFEWGGGGYTGFSDIRTPFPITEFFIHTDNPKNPNNSNNSTTSTSASLDPTNVSYGGYRYSLLRKIKKISKTKKYSKLRKNCRTSRR